MHCLCCPIKISFEKNICVFGSLSNITATLLLLLLLLFYFFLIIFFISQVMETVGIIYLCKQIHFLESSLEHGC